MKRLISCCGLDCAGCDARNATISDNDDLRKATAEMWSTNYHSEITPAMINCNGCREDGVKFSHCNVCEIRNCVKTKGYSTCADCIDLEVCNIVSGVHKYVPDALHNLKSLS